LQLRGSDPVCLEESIGTVSYTCSKYYFFQNFCYTLSILKTCTAGGMKPGSAGLEDFVVLPPGPRRSSGVRQPVPYVHPSAAILAATPSPVDTSGPSAQIACNPGAVTPFSLIPSDSPTATILKCKSPTLIHRSSCRPQGSTSTAATFTNSTSSTVVDELQAPTTASGAPMYTSPLGCG
jgi:hypothetical protein